MGCFAEEMTQTQANTTSPSAYTYARTPYTRNHHGHTTCDYDDTDYDGEVVYC